MRSSGIGLFSILIFFFKIIFSQCWQQLFGAQRWDPHSGPNPRPRCLRCADDAARSLLRQGGLHAFTVVRIRRNHPTPEDSATGDFVAQTVVEWKTGCENENIPSLLTHRIAGDHGHCT
jgi:hypothetical protein